MTTPYEKSAFWSLDERSARTRPAKGRGYFTAWISATILRHSPFFLKASS
jgi:hypothetical protein